MKNKLVAIHYENNQCTSVLICKDVDEKELNKLTNEENEHKQSVSNKEMLLYTTIESLANRVKELENEIKVLKGEEE